MSNIDALVAAFSEYAAEKWETAEWKSFGRGTGTSDILSAHDRLYRSLSFGDDDYPEAVWQVVPSVLREATGPSTREKMTLISEYAPELVTWIAESGTHRTKKRFASFLHEHRDDVPEEWGEGRIILLTSVGLPLSGKTKSVGRGVTWETIPKLTPNEAQIPPTDSLAKFGTSSAVASTRATADAAATLFDSPPSEVGKPMRIFIVHGHDHGAVNIVKLFVHKITGIMPEILADKPGSGNTIIEKFEKHAAESDLAIVLLTPDDEGRIRGTEAAPQPRARQNVVLELGYFFGKLGRHRVVVLNGGVEQPSDVHGLNYISYPGQDWKEEIRQELKEAGLAMID